MAWPQFSETVERVKLRQKALSGFLIYDCFLSLECLKMGQKNHQPDPIDAEDGTKFAHLRLTA